MKINPLQQSGHTIVVIVLTPDIILMEKASQDLSQEHDAILVTLNILEKICTSMKSKKKTDFSDIQQIIDFIRVFADKCHHGKEEKYFFPALEEAGVVKDKNQIGEIILEHELGRELIRKMQKSVSCNFIDTHKFISSSNTYISTLRQHIEKENTVLFPLADSGLSPEKQQELLRNFQAFEDNIIGRGRHDALHHLLHFFEVKYLVHQH